MERVLLQPTNSLLQQAEKSQDVNKVSFLLQDLDTSLPDLSSYRRNTFFSFFPLRYEVQVNKWIKCLLRSHLSFCWEDSMMWVCKKQYCHWKHWWNLQNYKIILRKMLYHVPHVIIFISLMSPMSLFIKIHSINDRISTTVADSSQIENILYDPGYLNGF